MRYCLAIKRTNYWEFPSGLVGKDPALSLLWCKFSPSPRNFHMGGAEKGKKKKKEEQIIDLCKKHGRTSEAPRKTEKIRPKKLHAV